MQNTFPISQYKAILAQIYENIGIPKKILTLTAKKTYSYLIPI
jgi:hypothetical protein